MDVLQAIDQRISCRAYREQPLTEDALDQLRACVDMANAEGGLRMVLVGPHEGGANLKLAAAMFSGQPSTYLALVAANDEASRDRLGYYGERVVLLATQLGLGTCWVAGTYDKASVTVELHPHETLHGVIPIGYPAAKTPLKQRTVRAALRKRNKKPQELYRDYANAPAWVQAGIDAVIKGPSAVNGQPVVFANSSDGIIATLPKVKSGVELLDLGIAKLHFELGAAQQDVEGTWSWGQGGSFHVVD